MMRLLILCLCLALGLPAQAQLQPSTANRDAKKAYEKAAKFKSYREWARMIEPLEEAIKLDPDFAEAYLLLGRAQRELLRKTPAYEAYRKAASLRPDNSQFDEAYYETATEAARLGDCAEAKANAERYLKFNSPAVKPEQVKACKAIISECAVKLLEKQTAASGGQADPAQLFELAKASLTEALARRRAGDYDEYERLLKQANESFYRVATAAPDEARFALAYVSAAWHAIKQPDYPAARRFAEQYLRYEPKGEYAARARLFASNARFAEENIPRPVPFQVSELPGRVNRFHTQYFPVLSADLQRLFFTAKTEPGAHEDIYESVRQSGTWSDPRPLTELNSKGNESISGLSADGRVMTVTYCGNAVPSRDATHIGSCDLYISLRIGEKWSRLINMGRPVNTGNYEPDAALTADGRTMYIASDRAGGYGGIDLWVSYLNEDGTWTTPANLGPEINTPEDERGPFLHTNGETLYFSSDGHPGFGGRDMYYAILQPDGKWSKPVNLGYPINTHRDEDGLYINADGKNGFFHVRKEDGRDYLATFELPKSAASRNATWVKGIIRDQQSGQPLIADVTLIDLLLKKPVSKVKSDEVTGEYLIMLPEGKEYGLFVKKTGYLFKSLTFNRADDKPDQDVQIDVPLEALSTGALVQLNNIFFDLNAATLQSRSEVEIERLARFMQENPQVIVELGAHTDDQGDDAYNLDLSERRAKAVKDALLKAGIAEQRIRTKGYGESQPFKPNTSEENRALNRRVEFKIL